MDELKIDCRELHYVIAAAEHGSFRRAALTLGVRESAISRRIRSLEDELGAALFIRSSSGVRLTHAGDRFVQRIRRAVEHIAHAAKEVNAIGRAEEGVVRIGLLSSLASGFLADLFRAFGANHSRVRLDFIEGEAAHHLNAIRQFKLDIAFLTGSSPFDRCDVAQLWTEGVYVAMPEADPLACGEEVGWEDLRTRDFVVSDAGSGSEIYDFLIRHLSASGYRPTIDSQKVHRDTLMQIVASGRGLTLISEAAIAAQFPGVVYRPLRNTVLSFRAVWLPGNDNPALRRLLSMAKAISKCRSGRL